MCKVRHHDLDYLLVAGLVGLPALSLTGPGLALPISNVVHDLAHELPQALSISTQPGVQPSEAARRLAMKPGIGWQGLDHDSSARACPSFSFSSCLAWRSRCSSRARWTPAPPNASASQLPITATARGVRSREAGLWRRLGSGVSEPIRARDDGKPRHPLFRRHDRPAPQQLDHRGPLLSTRDDSSVLPF